MTQIKKRWFLLVLLVLASCSSDELGPPRDVAYYMEHDVERKAVIAKCDNDPGRLGLHPNCQNARRAQFKRHLGLTESSAEPPREPKPPPSVEELMGLPVNWSRMTPEEKARYRSMTEKEKNQYREEQKRQEQEQS